MSCWFTRFCNHDLHVLKLYKKTTVLTVSPRRTLKRYSLKCIYIYRFLLSLSEAKEPRQQQRRSRVLTCAGGKYVFLVCFVSLLCLIVSKREFLQPKGSRFQYCHCHRQQQQQQQTTTDERRHTRLSWQFGLISLCACVGFQLIESQLLASLVLVKFFSSQSCFVSGRSGVQSDT